MVTKELLDYMKQQKAQGINEESIVNTLTSKGWVENDITTAMESLVSSNSTIQIVDNKNQPPARLSNFSNITSLLFQMMVLVYIVLITIYTRVHSFDGFSGMPYAWAWLALSFIGCAFGFVRLFVLKKIIKKYQDIKHRIPKLIKISHAVSVLAFSPIIYLFFINFSKGARLNTSQEEKVLVIAMLLTLFIALFISKRIIRKV